MAIIIDSLDTVIKSKSRKDAVHWSAIIVIAVGLSARRHVF